MPLVSATFVLGIVPSLYEETTCEDCLDKAKYALRKFLEFELSDVADKRRAWERIAVLSRKTNDVTGEIHALVELSQLPTISYNDISDSVNRINAIFKEHHDVIDTEEKQYIINKLIKAMEDRQDEAGAIDCSRLAWLFLNIHNEEKARLYTLKGLELDQSNEYCSKLADKFNL